MGILTCSSENIKIFSLKFMIMLVFLLFVGGGTSIFASDNVFSLSEGSGIYIALNLILLKNAEKFYNIDKLRKLLLCILCWIAISIFVNRYFDTDYIMLFLHVVTAYLIAINYREKFVDCAEKALFLLTGVALVGWIINNIVGSETLMPYAFLESASNNSAASDSGSFLLYIIGAYRLGFGETYRNFGFCWEPGRFASMIVMGCALHLVRQKGIIKITDFRIWVYIATLITTYSTTGYSALAILFALCLLKSNRQGAFTRILLVGVLGVAIFYMLSLDFMNEKIGSQFDESTFYTTTGAQFEGETIVMTATRFEGIMLDFFNFIHDPFVGYGVGEVHSHTYNTIAKNVVTSNGLTKVFAQYGLIMAIFFFYYWYKGSSYIIQEKKYNVKYHIFIVFLLISVSYNFTTQPFFLVFPMYSILSNKNIVP